MNRLWIRFSVIISGLCLIIIPLWVLIERIDPVISRGGISFDRDVRLYALPGELAETMIMVSTIAVILGVLLSRSLSAPIVALSRAAKQIGSGDLRQRVPVHNHSQELDDLARTFNKMAADLEHAETLRNNMLADISHELRTPLAVLSGQLQAALDKVVALDEEELANLYGQTQHLIHLVEDLRLLAQAEAHRLPLEIRPVNLRSCGKSLPPISLWSLKKMGSSFTSIRWMGCRIFRPIPAACAKCLAIYLTMPFVIPHLAARSLCLVQSMVNKSPYQSVIAVKGSHLNSSPICLTASTAPTHLALEIRAAAGWVWPLFRHW